MNVAFLACLTTIGWSFYHVFIKLSGEKIYPALGYVILNITALSVGALFVMYLKYVKQAALYVTPAGISYAVLAGLMVVLAEMAFFYIFAVGSSRLSILVPAISAASVAIVAIIGALFLGEAITLRMVCGIGFALAGIVLLTTE